LKLAIFSLLGTAMLLTGWSGVARAHDVRLKIRHTLPADQAAALARVFDRFNQRPGHPITVMTLPAGATDADIFLAAPADVAPASVVPLDDFLDAETRVGYQEEALGAVSRDGKVLGLPLTADGTLGAFIARDTRFPRESYDLVQYLTGPVGGAMLVEVEGLTPAHRGATPALQTQR
jgi:ABC-type glycerol-3-phosphate transport system substrate-binding protein